LIANGKALETAGQQQKCPSRSGKLGSKKLPLQTWQVRDKAQAQQCFSGKYSFVSWIFRSTSLGKR
jgi:hypothetical protein